ncbi:MAG TPA: VCBS repeat-containing protein, partial [Planctomycetota bacterium]|nr:VCBS repeat-containing protein [Planctomycetota bacterium]
GRGGFAARDLDFGLVGVLYFVAADFNGDARLDLAALAAGRACAGVPRGMASLLLGEASGGFSRSSMHALGKTPRSAVAADLGGRGLLDLVVLSIDGVWILFARGDGSLEKLAVRVHEEALSTRHGALAASDLNGDGRLDLMTDGGLLLIQVADRSFARGVDFPLGGMPREERGTGLAAADFDLDGDIDIATGLVAWNRGDAAFEEGPLLIAQPRGVTAGDWDGDGDADVALAATYSIEVRLNEGDGVFLPPAVVPTGGDPLGIWSLDIDLDQRLDIVALTHRHQTSRRISIHRNLGEGRFSSREGPVSRLYMDALAAADLDGDGDQDLVTTGAAPDAPLLILVNRGDGSFDEGSPFGPEESDPSAILPVDSDGDGDLDLILPGRGLFPEATPELYVLQNDGGAFSLRVDIPLEGRADFVAAAELNEDGALDLIVCDSRASRLSLLLGDGAGRFQGGPAFVREGLRRAVPADLDGDRNPEILAYTGGKLLVLSQDRGTAIVETSTVPLGAEPSKGFVAADLDGDGALDIAAGVNVCSNCSSPIPPCDRRPGISIILNRGMGGWEVSSTLRTSAFAHSIAAADLDGDADLDLAATLSVSPSCEVQFDGEEVEVFLNDGAGRFRSWGTMIVGERPEEVLMADLDADGLPEVLALTDEGELSILRNLTRSRLALDRDRDGVLDVCERIPFRRGDWNHDGRRDLTDAVALLAWLFEGAEAHGCDAAGDVDDDGRLGITDPIRLLHHLFQGGAPPPEPFESCGEDPTADDLPCERFQMCI